MTRLLKYVLWLAVLTALVFALWPQAPDAPGSPSDKLQHFTAFFTLAVLGGLAYPRLPLLRLLVILSVFGALIEVAQLFPAINRYADSADLLVDVIAATLGVLVVALVRRRWRRQ